MAHPYASEVKKGSQAKFKAMTGKKSSGQAHPDEAQDKALFKKMIKQHESTEEFKVGGAVSSGADKFARGGRAKGKGGKKGTHINIAVIAPGSKDKEAAPGLPPDIGLPPKPPMAPPPGMGPPGAGGPMPPGMPPMKRGGKVPMKGGGDSGIGRLDKIKAYGLKAKNG